MENIEFYHPIYNVNEFEKYRSRVDFYEKRADEIARYPRETRAKANRKHERMLGEQFGSISIPEFHQRVDLMSMWQTVHMAWRRDGMRLTNVTEGLTALFDIAINEEIILPRSPKLPTIYIHFGEHSRLALSEFAGNIEGAYIRPPQQSDNTIADVKRALGDMVFFPGGNDEFWGGMTVALVCARGGRQLPNASLESLIWNQSSLVFSRTTDNGIELIRGAHDMVDDPIVELANKMALQAYTVAAHQLGFGFSRVA